MFISSSKTFAVLKKDGTYYKIPRGFVGDIPDEIAKSLIVQLAIKDGSIVTPKSKKDNAIEDGLNKAEANSKATQKAKEDAKAKEDSKVKK